MAHLPLDLFLATAISEPLLEKAILQFSAEGHEVPLELDLVLDASSL